MAVARNYKFKCSKCTYETTKAWTQKEHDEAVYGGDRPGYPCGRCSFIMSVTKSNARIKDTFEPGWQQNVRKYFRTYQEYKQYFKDNGLVELGYEEFDEKPEDNSIKWNEAMLAKGAKLGLSGRELEALKQGKKISDAGQLKENLKKTEEYEKDINHTDQ